LKGKNISLAKCIFKIRSGATTGRKTQIKKSVFYPMPIGIKLQENMIFLIVYSDLSKSNGGRRIKK
jgi:hypothetical protein